jgi:hypothetical protein
MVIRSCNVLGMTAVLGPHWPVGKVILPSDNACGQRGLGTVGADVALRGKGPAPVAAELDAVSQVLVDVGPGDPEASRRNRCNAAGPVSALGR